MFLGVTVTLVLFHQAFQPHTCRGDRTLSLPVLGFQL